MIPYGIKIRLKAQSLRKKGKSFGQISKALGIGKSTVGFWFKNFKSNTNLQSDFQKKTLKIKFKRTKKFGVKKKSSPKKRK